MAFRTTLALAAALAVGMDVPEISHIRIPLPGLPAKGSLPSASSFPDVLVAAVQQPASSKSAKLALRSRLEIIRYVDGEFAKAVKPLPGGKKGFKFPAGKSLDEKELSNAVRKQGAAANPGDTVQITNIEFRDKAIVFQINGGAKKHFHWREHVSVGVGSAPTTTGTYPHAPEGLGAVLILEFGRPLPDMSPDDLKQYLSPFLDFSHQRSAAVNWVETLPPQFQQAIKDRHAIVGMDHEMVLAALGRPDHKVRERDPSGVETEDWIYGTPPAKTIFVTFAADKVIRVKEYN